jgi:hypothetical protein
LTFIEREKEIAAKFQRRRDVKQISTAASSAVGAKSL